MVIQDTYTKKAVRNMLENYQALESGDRMPGNGGNSGPKAYDGINSRFLLKIMLDDAITKLPKKLYDAVVCRWLSPVAVEKALDLQGTEKSEYHRRCDKAVGYIHCKMNGRADCYEKFFDTICT